MRSTVEFQEASIFRLGVVNRMHHFWPCFADVIDDGDASAASILVVHTAPAERIVSHIEKRL